MKVKAMKFSKYWAVAPSVAGILLQAYIWIIETAHPAKLFAVALFAFACVPYVICWLLTLAARRHPLLGFFGAIGALVGDAGVYYSVFVAPTSSTAAIGLLFFPLVDLLLLMPAGILVGYIMELLFKHWPVS